MGLISHRFGLVLIVSAIVVRFLYVIINLNNECGYDMTGRCVASICILINGEQVLVWWYEIDKLEKKPNIIIDINQFVDENFPINIAIECGITLIGVYGLNDSRKLHNSHNDNAQERLQFKWNFFVIWVFFNGINSVEKKNPTSFWESNMHSLAL